MLKKVQAKKLISVTRLALFALVLTSCGYSVESEDVKIVHQIQNKVASELTANGTLCVEALGASMFNEVKKISFRFNSPCKLSHEQARILYVNTVATYLREVNQNEAIRPYLIKHPFTFENSDIQISFDSSKKTNFIALMGIGKNYIYYATFPPEKNTYETYHRETFEEALKIVEESTGKKIDLGY